MHVHVHRETRPGERRVAAIPKGVSALSDAGHRVTVAPGAGEAAGFSDAAYREAGAAVEDASGADLLLAVGPIGVDDLGGAKSAVAFLDPLGDPASAQRFADAGTLTFSMELIPRTTKAQVMDALSSQATVAGYEAVLLGASELPRFLPMMMTAAGTIPPARVLVLGAGVAGLQAIATARRLGAVVSGYDIRPEAAEQIESLGASFVGGPVAAEAQMEGGYAKEVSDDTRKAQFAALRDHIARADLVIATAQIPGRPAPLLVTEDMVATMKAGAVIVDVAAPTGGNCELTEPGETVIVGEVKILGPLHLPSRSAGHASEMYSRNVVSLVEHLTADGEWAYEADDEIAAACCVTKGGAIVNDRVRAALGSKS